MSTRAATPIRGFPFGSFYLASAGAFGAQWSPGIVIPAPASVALLVIGLAVLAARRIRFRLPSAYG